MRLVTYRDRDRSIKPGVLLNEEVVDISDQVADIRSLIEKGPDALAGCGHFCKAGRIVFRLLGWNCWLRSLPSSSALVSSTPSVAVSRNCVQSSARSTLAESMALVVEEKREHAE